MKLNVKNFVGQKIKRWRLEQNITQEQLAHRLDLSQGYINQIENGKRSFTLETLQKVAAVLGLPLSDIFNEENNEVSLKTFRSVGRKAMKKGLVAQHVYLNPDAFGKKIKKKKTTKKEILEILKKLPDEVAEHYLHFMKLELKNKKRK